MYIIGSGKDAFLEFLRNLTPQALLFSAGIVAFSWIKKPWLSQSNIGYWALVFILLSTVLLAAIANVQKFMDNAFSGSKWSRRVMRRIKSREPSIPLRVMKFISAVWTHKRIMFIEFLVATVIVYGSLIATLTIATSNGLKALRAL